jgi:glycosyltransferase involved in cell wall biosynthesis
MIVKNEMDRYLPLAVGHLLSFVDEVRVLDDGSDDGTYEWLVDRESTGVKVKRNPGPEFFAHEGRARQNLLEWTLAGRPDYVLAIDADEFVGDPTVILKGIETGQPVYTIDLVEAWKVNAGGISIRVDGQWGPRKCPMLYEAPRHTDRQWRIADRALACGREPIPVVRGSRGAPHLETEIFHCGWLQEAERGRRAQRYFDHDGGKFHQNRHLQSILFPDEKVGLRGRPWPPGLRSFSDALIAHSKKDPLMDEMIEHMTHAVENPDEPTLKL